MVVYEGYREPNGHWVTAERQRELAEERAEVERMDQDWSRKAAERDLVDPQIGGWARVIALTALGRRAG